MKFRVIAADPPWPYGGRRHETCYKPNGKPRFGAAGHYPLMTLADICAVPVKRVAADDCLCFLWCTAPRLATGDHIAVLKAWGFSPSTFAFVWIKMNPAKWRTTADAVNAYMRQPSLPAFHGDAPLRWLVGEQEMNDLTAAGMGNYTWPNAEYVVVGKRGSIPPRYKDPVLGKERVAKQIVYAPRRGHSQKPDEVYRRVVWMYPEVTPRLELFARRERPGWAVAGSEIDGLDISDALKETAER